VIQELLVRGLDLDFSALGREQPSVLWLAAANNDLEVLQMCLACGADPHRDSSGVLPTEVAASTGALQALALLLRIGAVPGRAVHFAAATSQLGALRVLINTRAELRTRVNGLSALGVAVARDHDEATKLLLAQTWGHEPTLGSMACEALGLEADSNILHLAALGGLDRACDLLLQRGVRPQPAGIPRTAGSQLAQEHVRAVLEPHRWTLLRRLCPEEGKVAKAHEAFKQVLDEVGSDPKVVAICAGVGGIRPLALAALLDDAE
ncbi:hace1, partial [Symbiodinium pilosum]